MANPAVALAQNPETLEANPLLPQWVIGSAEKILRYLVVVVGGGCGVWERCTDQWL